MLHSLSKQPITHAIIALLCGVSMQFAFAPYHWIGLAIIALTIIILLLRQAKSFLTAYCFGFGWFGAGSWWLADTFQQYGGLAAPIAWLIVCLIGLVLGLFPALWLWASLKLTDYTRKPYALWLFIPLTAILMEWLRGHLFTGLPWITLGSLTLDTPLSAWLSVFGAYGAAFMPALLAVSLAALCLKSQRIYGLFGLLIISLLVIFPPQVPQAEGPESRVAIIQPNIPQNQKWDTAFLNMSMQRLTNLSEQYALESDLIIWPEAAVPFFLERSPTWKTWLFEHMQSWHTPIIFGGLKSFEQNNTAQNGMYLFTTDEKEPSFVGKHHLVPFGEYVPSWLPWLHKLVPDIGDFRPASDSGVLQQGTNHIGSLICYESIFPEEARQRVQAGANVLAIITNDAWYDHSPAAWQHLQAAQMRAIETGRYVLRAANTGIYAIIAPDGHITATAPWWTTTAVTGTYRTSSRTTIYQTYGDGPALFAASSIMIIWMLIAYGQRRVKP